MKRNITRLNHRTTLSGVPMALLVIFKVNSDYYAPVNMTLGIERVVCAHRMGYTMDRKRAIEGSQLRMLFPYKRLTIRLIK